MIGGLVGISVAFAAQIASDPAETLLKEHLSRVRMVEEADTQETVLYSDLSHFLTDLISTLRSKENWCPRGNDIQINQCIQNKFKAFSKKAQRSGVIDSVTANNLLLLTKNFNVKNGQFEIKHTEQAPVTTKRNKPEKPLKNNHAKLLGLYPYIQLKNFFSYRRQELNQPFELDQTLIQRLNKSYIRKINKIGRASIDEYILSRYNRSQIWALSHLLKSTVEKMTMNTGKIILARSDYQSRFLEIERLESEIDLKIESLSFEELEESNSEALSNEIEAIRYEILRIEKSITPLALEETKRVALEKKKALQTQITQSKDFTIRSALYEQILEQDQIITDTQTALNQEFIAVELTQKSIRNFAINTLRIELEREVNDGRLQGTQPNFGDVLSAALITGELNSRSVAKILELEPFHEAKHIKLKQWGQISLSIARTLSFLNPYTAATMTIASVIFESMRSQKENAKARAKETQQIQ